MNLSKCAEYFSPAMVEKRIHIIGCGSVGSTIAENLARYGITNMTLWDMDIVSAHNIANQMFTDSQINKLKVDALAEIICGINPDAKDQLVLKPNGWNGERLSGYIFLCVDNIELRKRICESIKNSRYVLAVFDVRTMLEGAQHYAADWSDPKQVNNLLGTMQFSHEEAMAETPVSACGRTLGVATTVRLISGLAVNNFINFVKGNGLKFFMLLDGFNFELDAA